MNGVSVGQIALIWFGCLWLGLMIVAFRSDILNALGIPHCHDASPETYENCDWWNLEADQ